MDYDKAWDFALEHGAKVLLFLLGLSATWLLSKWASFAVRRGMQKARLDLALELFLAQFVKYMVLAAGLMSCLGIFGIHTASFAALFAGAGLAIGMALQGTLGHFAAGICLLVLRPFRIGDTIIVSGETGKVAAIDIFNTAIDTFDNRRLIVPNGEVFGSKIENATFHHIRRVDVPVGVEYRANIQTTRNVLLRAVNSIGALADPAPEVVLVDLGASSVNWVVRVWAKTEDFYQVKERLVEAIKNHLDQEKLGIPFPQMDVHLFKDPTEAP